MSVLKKYENLSFRYKTAHSRAANYYSAWNVRLNVSNIFIVSLIGVSNNITSIADVSSKLLSVSYSIVLYFSVLVSTLQQFLKYEELAEKHRITSVRYNHLYNLCLLSDDTELQSIIEEYENIYNSAQTVPEHLKGKEDSEEETKGATIIPIEDGVDVATAHQLNRMLVRSYKA